MTTPRSWYDVLGVPDDATAAQIKRAYRLRVRLLHPDHHAGAAPELREEASRAAQDLNEAWAVLGDPWRKEAFDRARQRLGEQYQHPKTPSAAAPPPPGGSRPRPSIRVPRRLPEDRSGAAARASMVRFVVSGWMYAHHDPATAAEQQDLGLFVDRAVLRYTTAALLLARSSCVDEEVAVGALHDALAVELHRTVQRTGRTRVTTAVGGSCRRLQQMLSPATRRLLCAVPDPARTGGRVGAVAGLFVAAVLTGGLLAGALDASVPVLVPEPASTPVSVPVCTAAPGTPASVCADVAADRVVLGPAVGRCPGAAVPTPGGPFCAQPPRR
jgi:hypothetical protein